MGIIKLFEETGLDEDKPVMPYIIAEAGVNHEGDIELAKRLIDEAKGGGADAIKFQTYKAEKIASRNSPAYWDTSQEPTKSQYELFKKYDKFWKKEFEILKKRCEKTDIEFLSTPFDTESAALLNDMMDVFKISSSDITNKPFIEYICRFQKPIILSTGASYISEIETAVGWINKYGNRLALMHCVLNYPTQYSDANLGMISDMKKKFPDIIIGYSDHTLPGDMKTLEVATLLGARILEKHFTFDKTIPGNDHYHAMDKEDLIVFRANIDKVFMLLGDFSKHPLQSENIARKHARRSLVANRFIKSGHRIVLDDLTFKRPASGISPKDIDRLVGRIAVIDIGKDDVIHWDMVR